MEKNWQTDVIVRPVVETGGNNSKNSIPKKAE
jgi:hypothetical protein